MRNVLRHNVTEMLQNCRRIWENMPAILTYRNFKCTVQVIFVSVPRSKRKGKYHSIPCFKINSVFYKTMNPSDELFTAMWQQACTDVHGAGSQELDLQQAGRARQQLRHCETITEHTGKKRTGGSDQGQPTDLWLPATSSVTTQLWHTAKEPGQWGQARDSGVQSQV